MKKITILLVITFLNYPLYAQNFVSNVSKVGIAAAPFLSIGVGARPLAMGGAFVALANDASCLYWNPGGIAKLQRNEALLMHTEWLATMNFDYGGCVIHLGNFGTLGGSITALSMPELEVRTEDRPDGTGEFFSAGDLAMALTYARSLTDRFSIGFTAKYIHQHIWHATATGFAFDVGIVFVTDFFNGLRIGGMISNFGPDLKMGGRDLRVFHDPDQRIMGNNEKVPANYETDPWPLPINYQVGLAMDLFRNNMHAFTLAVDALHPSDDYESINIGGEYTIVNKIFLRAGYQSLFLTDSEEGLSAGFGFYQNLLFSNTILKLDYAFQDFGRLKSVHVFSLGLTF